MRIWLRGFVEGAKRAAKGWRTYRVPLLLFCILLLYNFPLIAMKGLVLGVDGLTLFYPAEHFLAQSLRAGTLPFWVPQLQSGFPLLADGQPGSLYPLNILAFGLLPTPVAHNWILIIHGLLGFLLTFWWGRTLGMHPASAGWAAFFFTLTTPVTGSNVPMLEAFAWAPGLFVFAEYGVQSRTLRAILPASLIVAFQWLSGFPQVAFYSLVMTFVYLCLRARSENFPKRESIRLLAFWGISIALGLAMSAPQWLSTYELSRYSIRAGGIRGAMVGERSFFPLAIVTYWLPTWRSFFNAAGLGGGAYVGLLPLMLAFASLRVRKHVRWLTPVAGVSVAALVLAFGKFSPLFPLVQRLPGFSSFRAPSRFLFFTQLGIAVLAGEGWEIFFQSSSPVKVENSRWVPRWMAGSLVLLLLNIVFFHVFLDVFRTPLLRVGENIVRRVMADSYHLQSLSYYEAKLAWLYNLMLDATSWRHSSTWILLSILGSATFCWRRCYFVACTRPWVRGVWGTLMVVDLLAAAGWMRATVPARWVVSPPDSASLILEDAPPVPYRVFWVMDQEAVHFDPEDLSLLPSNYHALFDLAGTGVYSPLGIYAYYRLLEDIGTVNLAFGLHPVAVETVQSHQALLNLLNVHYILSRSPLKTFPLVGQCGDVYVYRNEEALPRAFAVDRAYTALPQGSIIRWLKEDAELARNYAFLEDALPVRLTSNAAATSSVIIEAYTPTRIRLTVSATGNILVILTDTFYPGWRAYLDGVTVPIYRADGVFRAVAVPSGSHSLIFEYHPRMFQIGLLMAGIAVVIFLVLCLRVDHVYPRN